MDYGGTERAPLLLKISEAASLLRLGRTTLYELIAAGEVPVVRIGRAVRIPVRGLQAYAERIESEQNDPIRQ